MNDPAIILFAHGSREPDWARPIERLRDRVAQALGAEAVELAFLEHTQPTLEQAIESLCARGARHIAVVPLFLAAGGHLKRDLPRMLEDIMRGYPGVSMQSTTPLGEVESILDSIADWIVRDCAAA
jgi:sirohydrochlorin cobaltochelatase